MSKRMSARSGRFISRSVNPSRPSWLRIAIKGSATSCRYSGGRCSRAVTNRPRRLLNSVGFGGPGSVSNAANRASSVQAAGW